MYLYSFYMLKRCGLYERLALFQLEKCWPSKKLLLFLGMIVNWLLVAVSFKLKYIKDVKQLISRLGGERD